MSTTVLKACWPIKLSPAVKAVLISLADQADDNWGCWPSIGSMMERTCFSERAVRCAIRELESAGIVKVTQRRGHSSYYTICQRGAAGAPRHEPRSRGAARAPVSEVHTQQPNPSSVKENPHRGARGAPVQQTPAHGAPTPAGGAPPGGQVVPPEPSVEPSITKTRVRANPAIDIAQPPKPENPNPSLPDKPGQPYTDRAKLPSIMEALRAKITGTRPRTTPNPTNGEAQSLA